VTGTTVAPTEKVPWLRVSRTAARRLRLLATVWLVVLVAGFVAFAWLRGFPHSPEAGVVGRRIEVLAQVGTVAILVVGRLVGVRWHRTGAVLIAIGAFALGAVASIQYPGPVAVLIAGVTFLPAAMLWASWQRTARRSAVVELAVLTTLLLVGLGLVADAAWSRLAGPTHPASVAPAPSEELLDWVWAGAVTGDGFTVRARTREPADRVRLRVTAAEAGDGPPNAVAAAAATDADLDPRLYSSTVTGLEPGTRYTYDVEVDGRIDPRRRATLRTFPVGPASFTFATGSCAMTGSNTAVFDAIRNLDPLFFAVTGDFFYANITRDDPERFLGSYATSLRAPAQAALHAATPVSYVWDDHDYAADNADGTATSRPAAHRAYRAAVPHYPLRLGDDAPLFQAFTVGRVRVLITDNRSARTPADEPDGPDKTMLGEEQREALLGELRSASRYGAVIWVNPTPWVQEARPGADGWGGYATERRRIADAIAESGADKLVMVSGDAHMLALDDGSNTDYSTRGAGGFPLLHAAAG
jgi:phosphodiesterase/alkaline phosphatase D-like protein